MTARAPLPRDAGELIDSTYLNERLFEILEVIKEGSIVSTSGNEGVLWLWYSSINPILQNPISINRRGLNLSGATDNSPLVLLKSSGLSSGEAILALKPGVGSEVVTFRVEAGVLTIISAPSPDSEEINLSLYHGLRNARV